MGEVKARRGKATKVKSWIWTWWWAYGHHIIHLTQEANEDLEELTDTVKTLKDKYDEPIERAFMGEQL